MRDAVAATAALAVMLSALGARAQQPVPPPPGPPGAMQPGPMPPGPMPPQQPVPAPPSSAKAPQPAPPSAPFPPGAQPAPFPGAQPMPPGPGAAPRAPQAPGTAPPTPGMPGAPAPGMPPQGYPGYAPYGVPGYGQPYYPQPYYYYPPPVNVLPPAVLPYEEGEPVPMGYSVKTRPVRSMVIAGSVTFGATYLVSLLTASTVLAADSDDGKDLAPLFAPIVGPFITIGTSKAEGAGTLWLVLDGLAQTAGAVMLIYGLAAEEKYLQRTPQTMGFVENLKHPEVFVGPRTAALRWKF